MYHGQLWARETRRLYGRRLHVTDLDPEADPESEGSVTPSQIPEFEKACLPPTDT